MQTAPPNRTEIISAICALKRNKAAGPDGLPAELFAAAPAGYFFEKSWKSEILNERRFDH